jgi:hypothetical protein
MEGAFVGKKNFERYQNAWNNNNKNKAQCLFLNPYITGLELYKIINE